MEANAHESIVEQVERSDYGLGTASIFNSVLKSKRRQSTKRAILEQHNADAVHLHSTDVIPSYHGPKPKQPMSMAIPQAVWACPVQHDRLVQPA